MKNILSIFLLLLSCATHAQELNINTTIFVGGTTGDSSCGGTLGIYAISTFDKGVLVVGYTECTSGGGDLPPSVPDSMPALGGGNVVICKLDSNMEISWIKVYGGTLGDAAVGAVQTNDGGYAILAWTESNDHDVTGNHSPGLGDYWLIRIDTAGNLLWEKCYGSAYDEQPGAIALTPDNGFIMFGISNGAGDDVPTHYSGSEFDYDWFVVKTDSAGNIQWTKSIGGTGDEDNTGNILAANGGYYIVSSSNSTDYDCTDSAWWAGTASGTATNYYTFRLDTSGNIAWDSSYGGSGGDVAHGAIWDSRDSSIIINGATTSDDYMVTGYNGGMSDMWVVKTDKNGTLKWEKCLGGPNYDAGTSVVKADDGYIAYGSTDPGTIGQQDAWMFALDNLGNMQANKEFGGTNYDSPYSIASYKNGYAATGATNSQSFTEGINMEHLNAPSEDIFVSYVNFWPLTVNNLVIPGINIELSPNPTQDKIEITLNGADINGNITILNRIGQAIYSVGMNAIEKQISITTKDWPIGLYFLHWQGENGIVLTNKFIKN